MNEALMTAAIIAVIALVTWFTRSLPFILFGGKKELPGFIIYLGSVLPAAIMVILVVYCLRDVTWTEYPSGLAPLIAIVAAGLLQAWKKNTFISVAAGTIIYMILIRTALPI